MRITQKAWDNYVKLLRKFSDRATNEMKAYLSTQDTLYNEGNITLYQYRENLIRYAYALATKYGEGAGAAACEMYDAVSALENANVPPALPARTATYGEVAKAVLGTLKTANDEIVSSAVGRQVKMVGVDTMMQNALRDGAEWAWIPRGDTCAFCLTLASRGWQKASKSAIKDGHAEHIHANCDCTYAVRFSDNVDVEGYDPELYRKMYYDAPLEDGQAPSAKNRINAMRREFYAENGTTEIEV